MAARPKILQHLRKGKLLAGAIFPGFVATWNWLVDAFDGMAGDGDLNPQNGRITIDRTDPSKPVIRFTGNVVGAGNGEGNTSHCGRFCIDEITTEEDEDNEEGEIKTLVFGNTYYRVGGRTYSAGSQSIELDDNCIIALKVVANASTPSVEVSSYASVSALQNAEADLSHYIVPLFWFEDGELKCDMRIGPDLAMAEF